MLQRSGRTFKDAVARLDTATSDNQLADILNNSRHSTTDIARPRPDLRSVMAAARANEASLVGASGGPTH